MDFFKTKELAVGYYRSFSLTPTFLTWTSAHLPESWAEPRSGGVGSSPPGMDAYPGLDLDGSPAQRSSDHSVGMISFSLKELAWQGFGLAWRDSSAKCQ